LIQLTYASSVRYGVRPRGVATWQDEREEGSIGLDSPAQHIVTWHVRDLEGLWNGAIRALAKDGVVGER
jgi:hypothetical protein